MNNLNFKIIQMCLVIPFTFRIVEAQIPETKTYEDFFVVDTSSIKQGFISSELEPLNFMCYPDSIPPMKWFEPKYDTIFLEPILGGAQIDSVYVMNEWAKDIDRTSLSVLTLTNYSNNTQAIVKNINRELNGLVRLAINLQIRAAGNGWMLLQAKIKMINYLILKYQVDVF